MQTPAIEMKGITKIYPNGVVANKDVDFSVDYGEIHAVMGENGAGKSTLMKMLFGLEKIDKGEVLFEGKPIRIMVFILDSGVGFHMRIWAASTGSFFMDNTSTRLTMNWAETVAAAAPATPSPGIGPRPKIRMGSSMILAPIPMQFAIRGVRLLPEAV